MENNGIMTGIIPGGCNGLHKTYEESFFMYFSYSQIEKYFNDPKNYGVFYDPINNTIFSLPLIELEKRSSKLIKLEMLNVVVNNGIYAELIDSQVLHRHLVQEAYERKIMLEGNQKSL